MKRAVPTGHLLFRDDAVFFDGAKLHLLGFRTQEIEAQDRAVVDCLLRGESELSLLGRQVVELTGQGSRDEVLEDLRAVAMRPGGLLWECPAIPLAAPDVIVADFSPYRAARGVPEFVAQLRRTKRVLHLGIKENLGDQPHEDALRFETVPNEFLRASFFQFMQWARSVVRFHEDAVLVLVGPQDHVLFGDFAITHRTVSLLEPSWPSVPAASELRLGLASRIDPIAWIRELFYALRFNPPGDLHLIGRVCGSAFAALELYALAHADLVLYSCADHPAALAWAGREGGRVSPWPRGGTATGADAAEVPGRVVVVVADHEGQVDVLQPLFAELAFLLARRSLDRVALRAHGEWHELTVAERIYGLSSWAGKPPRLETATAAIVVMGMMRHLGPVFEVLESGIPWMAARATDAGPLAGVFPAEAWADDLGADALEQFVNAVADRRSDAAAAITSRTRAILAALDPARLVEELAAEDPPRKGSAPRTETTEAVAG